MLARVEPARLGPIAAGFHLTPPPGMIAAAVEKQPSAGLCTAVANVDDVRRGEQLSRYVGDAPEGCHGVRLLAFYVPDETGPVGGYNPRPFRLSQRLIENA